MDRDKKMKIEKIHAHFRINMNDYNYEQVGFAVTLEEGDDINEIVAELRRKACEAIGPSAHNMMERRNELASKCYQFEDKLNKLRKEWEATAQFLKAQGINAEAPSMPQFRNLIESVKIEVEEVLDGDDDNDGF
jgi:hypothetical protein